MNFTLRIWRQRGPRAPGRMESYALDGIAPELTFLEMLGVLNERLEMQGQDPVAVAPACGGGACGGCGLVINGRPHGPVPGQSTCQLAMKQFRDGQTISVEPWRAAAFPVIRDLLVDRSALDRIVAAGGPEPAGPADAGALPGGEAAAALTAAACTACGACVAACPNASAMLFTAAQAGALAWRPGPRGRKIVAMVQAMDAQGFGTCDGQGDCEAVCPAGISLDAIARLQRDYRRALFE